MLCDALPDVSGYGYDVFDRLSERYPTTGDLLLSPGRDAFLAAEGEANRNAAAERRYRLLRGYKRAGDILIQNALTEREDRDNVIFPALFNYRHYVELALKAAVEEHGALVDVSLGEKPNHKLPDLWDLFVKIVKAFGDDCSAPEFTVVKTCIDQLEIVDASSTAFRYAQKRNGVPYALPPGLEGGVDLVRLHDVMNGIENFFECVDTELTYRTDIRAEWTEGN
jgi:hypothetical protein